MTTTTTTTTIEMVLFTYTATGKMRLATDCVVRVGNTVLTHTYDEEYDPFHVDQKWTRFLQDERSQLVQCGKIGDGDIRYTEYRMVLGQ